MMLLAVKPARAQTALTEQKAVITEVQGAHSATWSSVITATGSRSALITELLVVVLRSAPYTPDGSGFGDSEMLCRNWNWTATLAVVTEMQRGSAGLPGNTEQVALPKITSDFDFLVGTWMVAHRTRSAPLTGSDQWSEFTGPMQAWTHFNGAVSIDEFRFPHRGTRGLTVRLFDAEAGTWSIYWVSSIDGALQKPVHGRFDGNAGYFYGDDEFNGNRSGSGTSGPTSGRGRPAGSRHSPRMAAAPGRPTGSWSSLAPAASRTARNQLIRRGHGTATWTTR
jgi:hypothetical protein